VIPQSEEAPAPRGMEEARLKSQARAMIARLREGRQFRAADGLGDGDDDFQHEDGDGNVRDHDARDHDARDHDSHDGDRFEQLFLDEISNGTGLSSWRLPGR